MGKYLKFGKGEEKNISRGKLWGKTSKTYNAANDAYPKKEMSEFFKAIMDLITSNKVLHLISSILFSRGASAYLAFLFPDSTSLNV